MNKKVVFGLMMNCLFVGFPLAIFSDNSKTTALYPCADLLFQNVWDIVNPEDQRHGRRYDGRRLEKDLFFILDGERNELYLYTPYFSGKADLKIDKNGRPILILDRPKPRDPKKEKEMLDLIQRASKNSGFKDAPSVKFLDSDDKSPGTPQYNIRVPYWPNGKNGGGAGFYYFTINDVSWGGHHDSRINDPPRFLSGPAESKPNFKREKPKGSIQIIQDDETTLEFHSLEIEDALWSTRTEANFSTEARDLLLRDMVARMGSLEESMDWQIAATIRGYRFGGIPPSREDLTASAQKTYSQVLDVCRESAKSAGETALLTQLDRQPPRIGQSDEDKATHKKWQSK